MTFTEAVSGSAAQMLTAARDPFTQYKPDSVTGRLIPSSRWQQIGATIGGPIIKNKLFFFGDYQATRQKNGISNQETIPTALLQSTCVTGGTYCDFSDYGQILSSNGLLHIHDPTTGNADGTNRMAFCGPTGEVASPSAETARREPSEFLVPVSAPQCRQAALNMLAAFPQPTASGTCALGATTLGCLNNFVGAGAGPYNQNSFDTRIDFAASQSVSVFGSFQPELLHPVWSAQPGRCGRRWIGPGGLAGSSKVHNYSLATGLTKTFSSSLLGDFRFGYFQYNPLTNKPDSGVAAMTAFGIPNANFGDNFTSGLGEFDMDGTGSNFGDGLGVARLKLPPDRARAPVPVGRQYDQDERQSPVQVRRRCPLCHQSARAERFEPHWRLCLQPPGNVERRQRRS